MKSLLNYRALTFYLMLALLAFTLQANADSTVESVPPPLNQDTSASAEATVDRTPLVLTPTVVTVDPLSTLADGNNAFGLDLYHALAKLAGKDENLVFSPYSVSTALAMTWVGARNHTQTQMASVLRFTSDEKTIGSGFHHLRDGLEAAGKNGGFDLSIANSIWLQKEGPFLQPFLDELKNDFNSPPSLVDFTLPDPVRLQINQWVENKTNEKIKDLLAPGTLDPYTKIVLVNAVYFKANWLSSFEAKNTLELPFHFSRSDAAVPMMHQTAHFKIAQNDAAQVLEMPYQGNRISMVIILPTDWKLSSFEPTLTPELLTSWLADMKDHSVEVKLPKFKFSYGVTDLSPSLEKMGMADAFSKTADFSGMTKDSQLRISHVLHKAFVNVDEKGTEAAAATASVAVAFEAIKRKDTPIRFTADHPFLFLIRDNQTHSILFMGRVADPRAE
jgi:serpin B